MYPRVTMSELLEAATPDQIKDLFHGVLGLTALKGKLLGTDIYWPGSKLALPESIRRRADCSAGDSESYSINVLKTLGSPAAKHTLAVITFTAPAIQQTGYEALQYKINRGSTQPLELACKLVANILPQLPTYDLRPDEPSEIAFAEPGLLLDHLIADAYKNAQAGDLAAEASEILGENLVTASSSEARDLTEIVMRYQQV